MLYEIDLSSFLFVCEAYEIERKTVWKCADKRNIFVAVTEGECSFLYGGKIYTAKKGQAVFIPADFEYIRKPLSDEAVGLIYIHFNAKITPVPASESEKAYSNCLLGAPSLLICDKSDCNEENGLIEKLREIIKIKNSAEPLCDVNASLSFISALSFLCVPLLKQHASLSLSADKPYPASIEKSLAYIKEHFSEKITVPDLCAVSFVTPQHLIRLFKKHLGATPIDYINRNKIARAIEMLRSTEMSVKEIAYSLGFDNPNYFSRLFMKEVGLSPLQKKAQIRSFD